MLNWYNHSNEVLLTYLGKMFLSCLLGAFLKMGYFRHLFLFSSSFQHSKVKMFIIEWLDLNCGLLNLKRLRCKLSHNHCPPWCVLRCIIYIKISASAWVLRVIHITAFSVCVCGRWLRFRREIENFLSLHWCSPLRKTQTAASSVNQPLKSSMLEFSRCFSNSICYHGENSAH